MYQDPREILIENYRKFDIFFNKDEETFHCVSDYYDTEQKKKTYAATKKAIDEYIKVNSEFMPFFALRYDWKFKNDFGFPTSNEKNKVLITGVRKDNRFVMDAEQISESDEQRYFIPVPENEPVFAELAPLIAEKEIYEKLVRERHNQIIEVGKKLTLINLKQYKKTMNS